mmetsp:Transcript_45308/g.38154  ORF Transcript_45308/g.38154 Transcript_45308/m.38154 type:complete len:109 (+) Transcript_45308:253-579(+)
MHLNHTPPIILSPPIISQESPGGIVARIGIEEQRGCESCSAVATPSLANRVGCHQALPLVASTSFSARLAPGRWAELLYGPCSWREVHHQCKLGELSTQSRTEQPQNR